MLLLLLHNVLSFSTFLWHESGYPFDSGEFQCKIEWIKEADLFANVPCLLYVFLFSDFSASIYLWFIVGRRLLVPVALDFCVWRKRRFC